MKLHFVDSGSVINDVVNSVPVPDEGAEVNLNELSNKQKPKIVNSEIKLIEACITDCIKFHLEHNNFPKITPNNIDVIFTEKHKFQQLIGKLINRQKAAHVEINTDNFNPNHQTISISTDLANFKHFNTILSTSDIAYKKYNDYTNKLKDQINKISSEQENVAHSRYIQTIFLHELAHTILNKAFRGTIFLEHFKRDTMTTDPVAQFSANVAEAFCDGFAGVFMTKQILNEERKAGTSQEHYISEEAYTSNIIEAMANARKQSNDLNPPGKEFYNQGFLYQYNFDSFLINIKNDIKELLSLSSDQMLNKIKNLALENAKILNNELMIKNSIWAVEFSKKLKIYINSTEFQANTNDINTILDNYFFKPSQQQLEKHKKNKIKI